MAFDGLDNFIERLEKEGELARVRTFADPSLVISEIAHRVTVAGGKALLFEKTGTQFPLLIN
ncbi:MAG: UbiD family decarboxylase, partial [Bacteroidales bacterium]